MSWIPSWFPEAKILFHIAAFNAGLVVWPVSRAFLPRASGWRIVLAGVFCLHLASLAFFSTVRFKIPVFFLVICMIVTGSLTLLSALLFVTALIHTKILRRTSQVVARNKEDSKTVGPSRFERITAVLAWLLFAAGVLCLTVLAALVFDDYLGEVILDWYYPSRGTW